LYLKYINGIPLSAKKKLLEDLIRPIVEGLGFEFWGMELLAQGKHSLLRIYIESQLGSKKTISTDIELSEQGEVKDGSVSESGIALADCEQVSRQVGAVMDVEDPISGDYTLEVSSPGMDRIMYSLSQYERFKGYHVAIKLRMAYEGRRKYTGVISGIEGRDVIVQVDQEEFIFPIEAIEKANIIPHFD
jgi:ribosome maturation factor RimP